jgi:hypothetical protein
VISALIGADSDSKSQFLVRQESLEKEELNSETF